MATRPYGGRSADERQRVRREALLRAAVAIAEERGVTALTVSGLCRHARLNDRYFYESFTDCDAVVVALVQDYSIQLSEAILNATTSGQGSFDVMIHDGVRSIVELVTADPGRARIALIDSMSLAEVRRGRDQIVAHFVNLALSVASEHTGIAFPAGEGSAAVFYGRFLFGGLAESMRSWIESDFELPAEVFIEQTAELFTMAAKALSASTLDATTES